MTERHLRSVPSIGQVPDLREAMEQRQPARLVIIKRTVEDGVLIVDKRLGPPPITPDGKYMIWLIPEEALVENAKEYPIVYPHYDIAYPHHDEKF